MLCIFTVEDQAFGYLEQEALHLFEGKEKGKDFEIEKDAIGNLFITWYGNNRDRMVMSGSHVDSVFRGGNYDGVAGVNSAFNFLRTLVEQEDKPENSYMVAVFRGEESSPKQEQPVSEVVLLPERLRQLSWRKLPITWMMEVRCC